MGRIRVGIIDDHPAMLLGTEAILNASNGIEVVAAVPSVTELLSRRVELDVVLLDLALADNSTPAANIAALTVRGVQTIAYTSGERSGLVREAARAGANGMIRKAEDPERIVEAILAVAAGEVVASMDWAAALDGDVEFVSGGLSRREREVLALYASGATAQHVAATLFISRQTVLDHVRRIRAKYAMVDREAPTKIALFQRAVEDGLITPEVQWQGKDGSAVTSRQTN
ncbi:MAG: response regulator transcription factor [Propionicimonas sp.]